MNRNLGSKSSNVKPWVLHGSQTLRTTMRKKLRQQPWHPAVGIVWQDHDPWSGIRQEESYELLDIGPWYLRISLDARAELFNFEDQHHVHWVASVLIPFAFQRMAIQIERRMAFQSSDFPQWLWQSTDFSFDCKMCVSQWASKDCMSHRLMVLQVIHQWGQSLMCMCC